MDGIIAVKLTIILRSTFMKAAMPITVNFEPNSIFR